VPTATYSDSKNGFSFDVKNQAIEFVGINNASNSQAFTMGKNVHRHRQSVLVLCWCWCELFASKM
jgi:hypothetical protein